MKSFVRQMHGVTMAPEIKSGDYLRLLQMDYKKNMYWSGHIHLVELSNGQEIVRRVYDEGDLWRLRAEDKGIPDMVIPKDYVINIYRVLALARLF